MTLRLQYILLHLINGVKKVKNDSYFNCKMTTAVFDQRVVLCPKAKKTAIAVFLYSNKEGDYGRSIPFTPPL